MHQELINAISKAASLPSEHLGKALVRPDEIARGDYAFPCFLLAKEWKIAPPECAKKLAAEIKLPPDIARVEVVGPYLNFFADRSAASKGIVDSILKAGDLVGCSKTPREKVIVEYSSPNIAKPFHIGHLRNVLIGLSIDRIYRFLGYQVTSVNHLGDWGVQFGFVWAGAEIWGMPKNPTVEELVGLYIRANGLKKDQESAAVKPEDSDKPDIAKMAKDFTAKLESGDADATKFWKFCLDISLEYIKQVEARLGVKFDHHTGESFYRDKLGAVETQLRESGVLEESRGDLGVDLGKKLGFARLFTSDGRSLYLTRDVATVDYRHKTFNPVKILYVVGAPQTLHFQQLVAIMQKIKHPAADHVIHVPYGHVPGISTRHAEGGIDSISFKALLNDAHERALEAYRNQVSKRPADLDEEAVAEAVALGAIFFNYLCRSNIKDFHFSWEDALNFQGDTGPYIQYALARLYSIESNALAANIKIDGDIDFKQVVDGGLYRLISLLAQFTPTVEKAAAAYEPYHVALYALEVARTFSSIYREHRVVGEEDTKLAQARLAVFRATRHVLRASMGLIGVPALERM